MIEKNRGFYRLNNEVLKFDVNRETDKIRFNHYLIQKENLQRFKAELPKGQFYLTVRNISKDLNITFGQARGLIKKFEKLNIITNVFKPSKGSKKPSIYQYNTVVFANTDSNTDNDTDSNTDKGSNINKLADVANTDSNTDTNTDGNTSKKELLKRIIKKDSANDFEEVWKAYPKKKGKAKAIKKMPKILQKYGKEHILRAIERYKKEVKGIDIQYILQGDTFFNGRYIDYLDENYQEEQKQENENIGDTLREKYIVT